MASTDFSNVAGALRRFLAAELAKGQPDRQLLALFLRHRDEAAFAALVRRHGPMVFGVCQRVLRNVHDAEDAFQATFLVLARKAGRLTAMEYLHPWLYGVAYRTALKARTLAARRAAHERRAGMLREQVAGPTEEEGEIRRMLDEEIQRLPAKYRLPIVLCYCAGRTNAEAARQLGWPPGTVMGRLARAREMLRKRLTRRGVTLSAGVFATGLAGDALAAVPASLLSPTVNTAVLVAAGQAATVVTTAQVAALMEGVLQAMFLAKLKIVTAALLAFSVIGAGTGVVAYRTLAAEEQQVSQESPAQPTPAEKRFENAPGWSWYYHAPRPRRELGISMSTGDILGRGLSAIFEDKDGTFFVYLAYGTSKSVLEYRPVAFDAERKRYLLKSDGGGGHQNIRLNRFRLDPQVLPADKAIYLGFEILTAEGREVAATAAAERARKAGVEVLPLPRTGEALGFALTTADGKKIRSTDLRGKVVLLDCWATWCSPCMAKMPKLKALYDKRHQDGLEIIGVCFDQDPEKAKQAVQSLGLTWPQVLVPSDEKTREFWKEAAGIDALPRLLLIDREGIFRVDCNPGEFDKEVSRLLDGAPKGEQKP
jgi:RNA polymerase sigma factor (sigma-70 family)